MVTEAMGDRMGQDRGQDRGASNSFGQTYIVQWNNMTNPERKSLQSIFVTFSLCRTRTVGEVRLPCITDDDWTSY